MIVDKKKDIRQEQQPQNDTNTDVVQGGVMTIQEAVAANPMIGAYRAVKQILQEMKAEPDNPLSSPLFKTIKLDNGQLARIKGSKLNREYGISFPAVFIHFINIRYNVGQTNIAEGKGTMRIHYVLNRLNNSDDIAEEEGLDVYKRIVTAINNGAGRFSALINRFQLTYWDQPLSFDDGLQPYWIDYEIWFNDYSEYALRNYVNVYATAPPFTQPSDQNEIANPDGKPNWKTPEFEEVAGFTGIG